MPLTYSYDKECEFTYTTNQAGEFIKIRDEFVIGQIERGLDFITKRTHGAITFLKVEDEIPDIMYICDSSNSKDYSHEYGFIPGSYTETLGEAEIYYYPDTNLFA